MTTLGTLSIHLDGARLRVGCNFCYLGARRATAPAGGAQAPTLRLPLVAEALGAAALRRAGRGRLASRWTRRRRGSRALVAAARAPVAVTTTPQLARRARRRAVRRRGAASTCRSTRDKGVGRAGARSRRWRRRCKPRHPGLEVVLIATLDTPRIRDAASSTTGSWRRWSTLPAVDKVALNALKPPPPWCDRALLDARAGAAAAAARRARSTQRLFLDCYVAARLLAARRLPGARRPVAGGGRRRLSLCVYQPAADFVAGRCARSTPARFAPPVECPFPIRCGLAGLSRAARTTRGWPSRGWPSRGRHRRGCQRSATSARRQTLMLDAPARARRLDARQRRQLARLAHARCIAATPPRSPVPSTISRSIQSTARARAGRDRATAPAACSGAGRC